MTPNFNLILSNKITVGANHKSLLLAPNGLKVILANQDNPVEKYLAIAIPTNVGNN